MCRYIGGMKPKPMAPPPLNPETLERVADLLRLLAHPQRLRIVELLQGAGELPVHDIMEQAGLPQAVASQHLNQMKRVGLLASTRKGKEVWYAIADPRSLTILDCMRSKQ